MLKKKYTVNFHIYRNLPDRTFFQFFDIRTQIYENLVASTGIEYFLIFLNTLLCMRAVSLLSRSEWAITTRKS